MPSSFLMCSQMVPSMSMMNIFKPGASPGRFELSAVSSCLFSSSFRIPWGAAFGPEEDEEEEVLPSPRSGACSAPVGLHDLLGIDEVSVGRGSVSKITFLSTSEILTGSGCCHTFLPTAKPAPPASMTPLTWETKASSVGVFGPPDITTFALPAAFTAQAKVFASPLYFILTMSAPNSSPALAAYATMSGLVSVGTPVPSRIYPQDCAHPPLVRLLLDATPFLDHLGLVAAAQEDGVPDALCAQVFWRTLPSSAASIWARPW